MPSVERYTSMQLVCFANQRFTFTHRYTTPRTEGLVLIDALTAVLFFHSEIHFLIFTLDISESDLSEPGIAFPVNKIFANDISTSVIPFQYQPPDQLDDDEGGSHWLPPDCSHSWPAS